MTPFLLALPVSTTQAAASKLQAASFIKPSSLCVKEIAATERRADLPSLLLHTIAVVESGRRDSQTGAVNPWPWTINAEGLGLFFESKEQAITAVETLQARGIHSIDVGCMQVNLMHHPDAFASLDQAFDPHANVTYAARFLNQLFVQTNTWPKAAAAYHSQTPEIGAEYGRRVMARWPLGARYAEQAGPEPSRQYTAEFASRMARDASDRAQLLSGMRASASRQRPLQKVPMMETAARGHRPSLRDRWTVGSNVSRLAPDESQRPRL